MKAPLHRESENRQHIQEVLFARKTNCQLLLIKDTPIECVLPLFTIKDLDVTAHAGPRWRTGSVDALTKPFFFQVTGVHNAARAPGVLRALALSGNRCLPAF
jgi:hypothetical protein